MQIFKINEASDIVGLRIRHFGIKIICVGVGGVGYKVMSHIQSIEQACIKLIAIDTEPLENMAIVKKNKKTLSFPNIEPEQGEYAEIGDALDGADIVFIITAFGGKTGTTISPIIAYIAEQVGALTIPIISMPSEFEDRKRFKLAMDGLESIKEKSDSVIIIQNEDYKTIEDAYTQVIFGIYGILVSSRENDINIDYSDIYTIMKNKGMALVYTGEYKGENAASIAINNAIKSADFDNKSMGKAMGALIHISMHSDYSLIDISEAIEIINEGVHCEAEVIFGTSTDENIAENYIKVTIILTGFEQKYSNLIYDVPLVPPPSKRN